MRRPSRARLIVVAALLAVVMLVLVLVGCGGGGTDDPASVEKAWAEEFMEAVGPLRNQANDEYVTAFEEFARFRSTPSGDPADVIADFEQAKDSHAAALSVVAQSDPPTEDAEIVVDGYERSLQLSIDGIDLIIEALETGDPEAVNQVVSDADRAFARSGITGQSASVLLAELAGYEIPDDVQEALDVQLAINLADAILDEWYVADLEISELGVEADADEILMTISKADELLADYLRALALIPQPKADELAAALDDLAAGYELVSTSYQLWTRGIKSNDQAAFEEGDLAYTAGFEAAGAALMGLMRAANAVFDG